MGYLRMVLPVKPRLPRMQIDWIDIVWPGRRHARGQYPRVQLYCLMSVAESWTDFHVRCAVL